MNKIKLPSMVEYLDLIELKLKNAKIDTEYQLLSNVLRVKDFVKQQPNISMFVPAVFEDGGWRILTKPIRPWQDSIIEEGLHQMYKEDLHQYQTALDNVIFEGFEYDGSEEGFIYVKNGETLLIFDTENKTLMLLNNMLTDNITSIEDFIPYSLTLTPKFAKELGL
jgi:hypothetical protein